MRARVCARCRQPSPRYAEPHAAGETDREEAAELGGRNHGEDRIAAGGRMFGAEYDRLTITWHFERALHHRPRVFPIASTPRQHRAHEPRPDAIAARLDPIW